MNLIKTAKIATNMNAIEKSRLQFAQAVLITVFFANIGGIVAQIFVIAQGLQISLSGTIATTFFALLCVALWFLLQRGMVEFVASVLVLGLSISTIIISILSVNLFVAVLAIISASIIINNWIYGIATGIILSNYIYRILLVVQEYGLEVRPEGVTLVLSLATLITLSIATRFLLGTAQNTAQEAQRASTLLRTTSDISQITSKLLDIDQLFGRAVELIRDRFVFYHVQIFLVDDNREYANLVASTGEIGQMLLERKHRILVGSTSVIGRVTQIGDAVIASDTDTQNALHARNELLPNTRSELAVAITDGERIIGALDVQSTRPNAFSPIDIQTLEVVANQLGTAIRNARLFEAQASSLQENKRLFFESESSLREIQRLNRQLTRKVWGDYLIDKGNLSGVIIEKQSTDVLTDVEWTPRMIEASQRRRPSIGVSEAGNPPLIAVPIVLRGEVIGAIEVQSSHEMRQDDSVEVIQAVAQRLALSLDNARLFEETQLNVQQQQAINDIVGKFQSAVNVDELLQMTLIEIGQIVGAGEGAIRLGSALVKADSASDQLNGNGKV
ncbi:MAG: GAF domain-containing protein [Phototrophicales bacterium]|nr:GAF domain-containing protein [Phototrophicales bacterium]